MAYLSWARAPSAWRAPAATWRTHSVECVLVAGAVEEFLEQLPPPPPRLVHSDIGLPGLSGIEGVTRIKRVLPKAEVVLITVFANPERLLQALCAGAVGYLLKSTMLRDVKAGLLEVPDGGSPMLPAIARHVVRHFQPVSPAAEVLSARELQLVQAIEEGLSYRQTTATLESLSERLRAPEASGGPYPVGQASK